MANISFIKAKSDTGYYAWLQVPSITSDHNYILPDAGGTLLTTDGLSGAIATEVSTQFGSYTGSASLTTLGTITTGVWNGSAIIDTYISSANTWNAKLDDAPSDNKQYARYNGTWSEVASVNHNHDLVYQPISDDLSAIDGLVGNVGFLYKSAENVWALDTNTYSTTSHTHSEYALTIHNHDSSYSSISHTHSGVYQPASSDLSAIDALSGNVGFLYKTAENTWSLDTNTYSTTSHNHDDVYSLTSHTHSYLSDAPSDGSYYCRKDAAWVTVPAGFTNPMTTLGDFILGGTSGTATRFTGNNTTTRKYLSQISDGSGNITTSWEEVSGGGGGGNPTITNDTTTNSTMYPVWVTANTGTLPLYVSSDKYSFNPSTDVLTSGGLSLTNNIVSTSATSGALTVAGSVGISHTCTNSSEGEYGVAISGNYNPTVNTGPKIGLEVEQIVDSACTKNFSVIYGLNHELKHKGSGTITTANGISSIIYTESPSTGTITTARGFYSRLGTVASGSTLTNAYHFYGTTPFATGTVTNYYGLYLESIFGATTNNYAIYTNGGKVKFGDTTASTSSTTGALVVSGGVGISGALNASGNITATTSLSANYTTLKTASTTGLSGFALGYSAGNAFTSSSPSYGDILIGHYSGQYLVRGAASFDIDTDGGNTLIGYKAGYAGDYYYGNTAVGSHALSSLAGDMIYKKEMGCYNTAVGGFASRDCKGKFNTTLGWKSHRSNIGGYYNVSIGTHAALNDAVSSKCVYIGSDCLSNLIPTYKNITAFANYSSGVSKVTCSSHGFTTGDAITIAGCRRPGYNGDWIITVIDSNSFTIPTAFTYTDSAHCFPTSKSCLNNVVIGYGTALGVVDSFSNNTILGSNISGLPSTLSNNVILSTGQGNIRLQFNGTDWNVPVDGGNFNIDSTKVYKVGGTQVVGAQQATVAAVASADATDLATALTLVNELKAQYNDLLAKVKTHGLIASA